MFNKKYPIFGLMVMGVLLILASLLTSPVQSQALGTMEQLGKSIFFDQNLSFNGNQSCASCHAPEVGFTGPISAVNAGGAVYEGSILDRFGNRKPPSAAYATSSPILHYMIDKKEPLFIGGNFWDGRATGERLGNPAADQAQGPFLNPMEQALSDNACVVYRVCNPAVPDDYPVTFGSVFGANVCSIAWPPDVETTCATENSTVTLSPQDRSQVDMNYDNIALAIAAYEGSSEVNAFTSKYDYYLMGQADLTFEEKMGFNLFKGKGKCNRCHILDEGPNGEPPLFTDFTYDNLGVPKNLDNPFYITFPDFVDLGLGEFLGSRPDYSEFAEDNYGKQKVPTLRNVDLRPYEGFVKAYAHNGYFKSLEEIVHFYNTRDLFPTCFGPNDPGEGITCWPPPEFPENVNDDELGNLHLTEIQEVYLVEFLKTLSDGYQP